MIFLILASFFCGSSFYKMGRRYDKSGLLFGIAGVVLFLFFYTIVISLSTLLPFIIPFIDILGIVVGAILCYAILIYLDKHLQKDREDDILDSNL